MKRRKMPYIRPEIADFQIPIAKGGPIQPLGTCSYGANAGVCAPGGGAAGFGCSNGTGDDQGCNLGSGAAFSNDCYFGQSAIEP